jgi:hypothetical protein
MLLKHISLDELRNIKMPVADSVQKFPVVIVAAWARELTILESYKSDIVGLNTVDSIEICLRFCLLCSVQVHASEGLIPCIQKS